MRLGEIEGLVAPGSVPAATGKGTLSELLEPRRFEALADEDLLPFSVPDVAFEWEVSSGAVATRGKGMLVGCSATAALMLFKSTIVVTEAIRVSGSNDGEFVTVCGEEGGLPASGNDSNEANKD